MPPDLEPETLSAEIRRLSEQMERWNDRYKFWRLAMLSLVRGLMLGLGTALGATALVSVVVLLLSQIEFIPILGDMASALIEEIETETPPDAEPLPDQ